MTNLEKLQKIASFRIDMSVDVKFDNGDIEHHEYETIRDLFPEYFAEIETTLKKYEELTSKPVIMYSRTHERTQALIDIVCKNYKEVKITNLGDEKKLKALDIIKEKKVNVNCIISGWSLDKYNSYKSHISLTKKEYDLLKEILK